MDGSRRHDARHSLAAVGGALAVLGLAALIAAEPLAAQGASTGDEVPVEGTSAPDRVPDPAPDPEASEASDSEASEAVRGAMIPRAALVDMTRAQSGVICTSEIFLGCMAFGARECLALSESAIDECLMTLPPEIDPATLDNATLEACPKAIYALAGHDEAKARDCFEKALDES